MTKKRDYKAMLSELGPFLGLIFVFVLFTILTPSAFTSFYNIKTILTQSVIIGIAAYGTTFIIVSEGIDLSVGSQIALTTVIVATVLNLPASDPGLFYPLLALAAGVLACTGVGAFNGFIITKFRIVPFIVTLGTMQIVRGLAKWIGKEQTVATPSNWLTNLMLIDPSPSWLIFGPGVWLTLVLLFVSAVLLKYTVLGRYTFAIGSNEQTARLCGIKVDRMKIVIYALGGLLTGIAGVMQYSYLTVGDPTTAVGLELDIIAAVVIGGGSLSGGEGSVVGSIFGALIMAVLRNGSNMLGLPNYVQEIIIGTIIVGAVLVDQQKHRLRAAG
ncbi:MAG: ABC transporter permease [Bacteroidetes bacterium SB0662_bin_6]|nr:ABC transporter permease [Bacteroidetes bacterium SB0668_bin_1]MYE03829.1 ABC transporter permease [Bacteroidetes bacterium SB0662_bin_6]